MPLVELSRVNIHSNDSWPAADTVESTTNKVFVNPALVAAVFDHSRTGTTVIRLTDGRKGFLVAGTSEEVSAKLDGRAAPRRSRAAPRLISAPTSQAETATATTEPATEAASPSGEE